VGYSPRMAAPTRPPFTVPSASILVVSLGACLAAFTGPGDGEIRLPATRMQSWRAIIDGEWGPARPLPASE